MPSYTKPIYDVDDATSYQSHESSGSAGSRSSGRSKKTVGAGIWFKWSSAKDVLLFTTACTVNTSCYATILEHVGGDPTTTPNLIHFLLTFILVALPYIYMMVSIGQYTQKGIICIKEMCPLVHGTAYTAFLIITNHCVECGINMSKTIIYLLSSLSKNIQWLMCPKHIEGIEGKCWNSKTNCSSNCLKDADPSALIYYRYSHLGTTEYNIPVLPMNWVIKKLLPLATCWFLLIVCLGNMKVTYRKQIAILFFLSAFLSGIVFIGCVLKQGSIEFMTSVFGMSWMGLMSMEAWTLAFCGTFEMLSLGRCLHIVVGTFLSPKSHSGLLSIAAAMLSYLVLIIMSSLGLSSFGILQKHSNTSTLEMAKMLKTPHDDTVFAIIPQSFDYQGMPQFWSFAYFLSCLLIEMLTFIIDIIILERCFTDFHPKLQKYRVYTALVITTLVFFICLIGYRNILAYMHFMTVEMTVKCCEMINTCIIVIVVCIFYGVEKLCDDMHFTLGNPPTRFWKICWYPLPLVYFAFTCLSINLYMTSFVVIINDEVNKNKWVFITIGIVLSPIILFAALNIWQYIKKKNLAGVIKSTEFYGPGDPEERYLRIIHNPRTEIKSSRKYDVCAHRCLIGNRAFRKASAEEERESQDFVDATSLNLSTDISGSRVMSGSRDISGSRDMSGSRDISSLRTGESDL